MCIFVLFFVLFFVLLPRFSLLWAFLYPSFLLKS